MKKIILSLSVLLIAAGVFAQEKLPKIQREFRGMWIATVANLDFPSTRELNAEQQKEEIIKLLDLAQELKINAVVFQVSSMQDAMYESELVPSSEFLTGKMGMKLEFDVLKFVLDESHKRGIVVHAWFNPYRASHATLKNEVAENHITKVHPDWIVSYGKLQMLDPARKDVQDYLTNVVSDVVKRYDVDGVHFDDYFYPYPDADKTVFADDKSWDEYKKTNGKLAREDWRRKNVDDLIQRVGTQIKKIKPAVMFGVSPFGIWKPDEILGIKGLSSYDAIYSDSRKWLQEGWVDYLAPQLYWSTTSPGQQFPVLLKWWNEQNKKKRHLWVGVAPYRIGTKPEYSTKDFQTQIELTRGLLGDDAGAIHFRALSFVDNKDQLRDTMREKVYARNAIIPSSPWIPAEKLSAPEIEIAKDAGKNMLRANWKNIDKAPVFRWILYWKDDSGWKTTILPSAQTGAEVPLSLNVRKFAVAAVDRLGNVSETTFKAVE